MLVVVVVVVIGFMCSHRGHYADSRHGHRAGSSRSLCNVVIVVILHVVVMVIVQGVIVVIAQRSYRGH
jgi:heme/copper-type cytochrome/quinol oxidase subunit 2